MKSFLIISLAAIFLTSCGSGDNLADLEVQMEEIQARPKGRIDPPPEFRRHRTFNYAAHQLRSPFLPPDDDTADLPLVQDGTTIEPPIDKAREYLERFSLDSLKMVGTITRPGEPLHALVKDPEGTTTPIKAGSYMGKNYGRIIEVQETKISIIEIVPSGTGQWVERPRSVGIR